MTRSRSIDPQAGIGGVRREEREEGCMLLLKLFTHLFVKNIHIKYRKNNTERY